MLFQSEKTFISLIVTLEKHIWNVLFPLRNSILNGNSKFFIFVNYFDEKREINCAFSVGNRIIKFIPLIVLLEKHSWNVLFPLRNSFWMEIRNFCFCQLFRWEKRNYCAFSVGNRIHSTHCPTWKAQLVCVVSIVKFYFEWKFEIFVFVNYFDENIEINCAFSEWNNVHFTHCNTRKAHLECIVSIEKFHFKWKFEIFYFCQLFRCEKRN